MIKSRPNPVENARRVVISLEIDRGFKRHLDIYAGCQRFADEAGWNCSIHPAPERDLKSKPNEHLFDGIIARATPELEAAASRSGVPIVNVWLNSPVKNVPSVFPDFEACGAMAADHLMARGFRHFAYLGYLSEIDSRMQLDGFSKAVGRKGFPCTTHRFSRASMEGKARGWGNWVAGVGAWIDTWTTPIGVFVCDDLYCRFLIDLLRSRGLHVSQDVAIVGPYNEGTICEAPQPTLTSIDANFAQVGYRAAAILDDLMRGHQPPSAPELVVPAELVPRQSTDAYAADDPMVARALRFIAEHGHERIEVKEVVSAVGTNRRTLERNFRESAGRSIAGEITRMRLERAKRRMVETDAPMKDVALDAGFRNADHFYKVFARVEGLSPTQYRDQRQQAFPSRA